MSLPSILDALPQHPAVTWMPFHIAHFTLMSVKAQNTQAISRVVPMQQMLEAQANAGQAITAMLHGRPAAVFGSVSIWRGVEELWMLCEERARKYPVLMTKAGRIFLLHRVIAGNLHRIQATVRCDDLSAIRWAESLGLEYEGVMRRYGADQMDYQIMART